MNKKIIKENRRLILTSSGMSDQWINDLAVELGWRDEKLPGITVKSAFAVSRLKDWDDVEAIYFPGGNTFNDMLFYKNYGFYKKIVDFINRGGIYIGMSAGSIMATNTVTCAQYADYNTYDIPDDECNAFDIFEGVLKPHSESYLPKYGRSFHEFSKKHKRIMYCINDGACVVVDGERILTTTNGVTIIDGSKPLEDKYKSYPAWGTQEWDAMVARERMLRSKWSKNYAHDYYEGII